MSLFSVRRFASACVISAAAAAALAAPGSASAFSIGPCQGESITGFGSSLQSTAQKNVWNPDFNTSSVGCTGTEPTVKYTSGSSGEALESWGVNGHATNYSAGNAFTATDQPANPAQALEITKNGSGATGTLRTIPVLQAAVAILVHLPANCVATSTAAPGRLALANATLNKIFQGTAVEWRKVFKATEGGDVISGSGCNTKSHITRVVRSEGSGTTATFKKYLHVVFKKEVLGTENWEQLAEAVPNTAWPNEGTDPVVRGVKGPGVVAQVVATPGSVGYANLADARTTATVPPTGGAGKSVFWVELEHQTKPTKTYADPSTDGDSATKENANCEETLYTNGKKKFPPPSTSSNWNEVTSTKTEKNYPLCGFTYDQAFTHYGDYPGTTEKEARTVFDYEHFVLSAGLEGGQTLLNDNDYLGLPTSPTPSLNVLKIAQEGGAEIGE